jgi:aryl-alcohol dehydrogenase-like predicted oxidoreductase
LEKRGIGTQGLSVTTVGLGCMGMSDAYGPSDEKTNIEVVHKAIEMGVNHFDTADMYGPFHNEVLLGKAIAGHREDVIVATKFGNVRKPSGEFLGVRGDPKYVKEACEASLKRLGIETIDLYYQHRVDTTVPIEETVGAMAELVHEGKVRYLGLSEASASTIRRAHKVHPISALQSEYSLWSRDPEDEVLSLTEELGIGFVAYSPLGRGFLTGNIKSPNDLAENDARRRHPRFQGDNFQRNLELVKHIERLATEKGVTPAQIAIAWVLGRAQNLVTIPGTRSIDRLAENVEAANVRLGEKDLQEIDSIFHKGAIAGDRYPDMSTVNR